MASPEPGAVEPQSEGRADFITETQFTRRKSQSLRLQMQYPIVTVWTTERALRAWLDRPGACFCADPGIQPLGFEFGRKPSG